MGECLKALEMAVEYIEELIGSDADESETYQYLLATLKELKDAE